MPPPDLPTNKIVQAHRVVGAVFGFAFATVGLILIGWLWLQPFGFMHPPLIFRLLGTMVAIIFVAVGSMAALASLQGRSYHGPMGRIQGPAGGDRPAGYQCPACGAGLSDDTDVSPSGDVKCTYCRTWFNVHR